MKHRAYVVMSAFLVAGLLQDGFGIHEAAAREILQFGDAGFFSIDYQLQARVGARDQGPAYADENTRDFYLRRNRLSFIGAANETFGAVVQLELNGGQQLGDTAVQAEGRKYELVLLDAYATADVFDFLRLRAGKTKHVLTREVQEGCFDPLSIDRSPFILGPFSQHSPEKTTRDVGLVLWGNVYDKTVQYRLAVMQGNDFGSGMPDGIGYRYTGRVHVTFFDKEAGPVYRGTYLGKKRVLTLGAGYELQPDAVYSSWTTGAEDYKAYTFDLFYEHPTPFGTFTVSGAYLETDFGEAGTRNVADARGAGGERNGYYGKAGYMRWNFQVFGRYERWSFANLNDVPGQKLRWLVAGVNYYFKGQDARLTLEFSTTDFEREPAADFHTVLLQAQARF
jgi:hypothetical protein